MPHSVTHCFYYPADLWLSSEWRCLRGFFLSRFWPFLQDSAVDVFVHINELRRYGVEHLSVGTELEFCISHNAKVAATPSPTAALRHV